MIVGFDEKLRHYLEVVKPTGHAGKRILFLDFVRDTFGIPLADYQVEERVYGGRVDALLGNLVFEFKDSLARELSDAELQLKRYITELKKARPAATYTGIATDGLAFRVYAPLWDGSQVTALEPIGELDLEKKGLEPRAVFLWLDSLLAHFREGRLPPTTENVVAHVGPASPAFRTAFIALHSLYRQVAGESEVKVRFQQWKKHLALVYGEETEDPHLFVKHTFLATLAKLVVYLRLERRALPIEPGKLRGVITGDYFQGSGIINHIEEDFFTWFLHPKVAEQALEMVARLARTLATYDFSLAQEDALKALYEGLVDPEARHDLGEYYTPDWLAEYMLDKMLRLADRPEMSLLDPGCGSGTFLFSAIRIKKRALAQRGVTGQAALKQILDSVHGVDVHPLAVTISRANYLLALGELVEGQHPPVVVPVYLSNSLRLPRGTELAGSTPGEDVFTEQETDYHFQFPGSLTVQPVLLDQVVEVMRSYLKRKGELAEALRGLQAEVTHLGLTDFTVKTLVDTFEKLWELDRRGEDTLWLFILKNAFKPLFLSQRQFDAVVGNPPWLSFRYIKSPAYSRFVRDWVLRNYKLLSTGKGHLFTHMELASLFFVRSADLYLRDGGTIAFVMPRAVMTADQHADFTRFHFVKPHLGEIRLALRQMADVEGVSPLFHVPACVLVATKGADTTYPVPGLRFEGGLPAKDVTWIEAAPHLTIADVQVHRVEGKLLSQGGPARYLGKSYYADKFHEGATIVPRNCWFVQLAPSRLGVVPTRPNLETSEEVAAHAKPPWKDLRLNGPVEADFIYATLLGGDILPFAHLPFRAVVLPIAPPAVNGGERPILVGEEWASQSGYPWLRNWLEKVEAAWAAHAKRDEADQLKATAIQWLDWRRKLTKQLVSRRFKVLYNASGTNISACVVDTQALPPWEPGPAHIAFQGFVAESKTYWCSTDTEEEANYLSAILNSPLVDSLVKPLQSRGLWGARDIHKKPLAVRIPRYDASKRAHRELARLGQECHHAVRELLPELAGRYRNVGRLRMELRHLLEDRLDHIDRLVRRLLEAG